MGYLSHRRRAWKIGTIGGGGGSFAFVSKNSTDASGSGSGLTTTVQLTNIQAGDFVVVVMLWDGAATTCTVDDGTSTLTEQTASSVAADGGTTLRMRTFYLLSSVASGTLTYTSTLGAGRTAREILAIAYRPSGTVATDGGNHNGATSGSALTSGDITTTGTTELVIGAHGYGGFSISGTPQINGQNADQTQTNTGKSSIWAKTFTSTFTGGASATLAGSDWWVASIAAFKI